MTDTIIRVATGTWDIVTPAGVTVAPSVDAQTGFTTGLRIFIDYTYSQYIDPKASTIHFLGPVPVPNGTPQPGDKSYPFGMALQTTLEIRNDLGVPMQGLNFTLVNDSATKFPGRDTKDAHPNDYAHFHQIVPTSLHDKLTGTVDASLKGFAPTLQPAFLGLPTPDQASPSIIDTFGFIQPDAIAHLGGANPNGTFTLHSEDTPGPTGGSFTLSWFTLDADPKAPDPNTVRVFSADAIPTLIADHLGDGKTYLFAGISADKIDLPALVFADQSTNALTGLKVVGNSAVEPMVFGDISLAGNTTVTVAEGLQVGHGTFTIEEAANSHLTLNGKSTIADQSIVAVTSPEARGRLTLNGDLTLGDDNNFVNIGAHLDGNGMMFITAAHDTATVNAVDGVTITVSAGTLNVEHPTDFHGTLGPIGETGVVNLLEATEVTHATFDTTSGTLHLLTNMGVDRGDLHMTGNVSGLTLNRILPSDSFIALHNGGGIGNIPISFT